jgi:hypothetical protein
MPLYPFIVLRTKERTLTPCSFVVFSLGFTFESLKELGVCHETFSPTHFHTQILNSTHYLCDYA